MKRSEALVKLKEKYKLILMKTIRTERNIDEAVDELLQFVENDLGMSPPDSDGTTYCWDECIITPPEWESENEKV